MKVNYCHYKKLELLYPICDTIVYYAEITLDENAYQNAIFCTKKNKTFMRIYRTYV